MPQDFSRAFLANPQGFILMQPIALSKVAELLVGPLPMANNLQRAFALYANTRPSGTPLPVDEPALRMTPTVAPGPFVLPGGSVVPTFLSWYLHASDGGMALPAMRYVDIPITPTGADPLFVFTTGMNGCTLVVATAVPAGVPPLPAGHWRLLHDRDHRTLVAWQAAGFTLRFLSYADPAHAGPMPPAWARTPPIVTNYNPRNFVWGSPPPVLGPAGPITMRVVTNFLWWNGAQWTYNSRHAHTYGAQDFAFDAPLQLGVSNVSMPI